MTLSTGQVLKDRYRVAKLLGQGGFGAVYRAWDVTLNTPCALKENFEISEAGQKQFLTEARILAGLRHPNLPRVTDYFVLPGQGQYLVMDFVEGEDLRKVLESKGVPLDENLALSWIQHVCDALEFLHSQNPPIIHRDIKPANIKITPNGQAMLVDFGIAKIYDASQRTTMGARAVTPGYSAPEQYGLGTTDVRSDIYSLAATLYAMLTAQEPLESVQRTIGIELIAPQRINPLISDWVQSVILKAMEPIPAQRYQTVREFRQAIGQTGGIPAGYGRPVPGFFPNATVQIASSKTGQTDLSGRSPLTSPVLESDFATTALQSRSPSGVLRKILLWLLAAIITAGLVWAGLGIVYPYVRSKQLSASQTALAQVFTATVPATFTPTETEKPTATSSPTLAPTFTLELPVAFGTPLPITSALIAPTNVSQLMLLADLPIRSRNAKLLWAPTSRDIFVAQSVGISRVNLESGSEEHIFSTGSFVLCLDLSSNGELLAGGTQKGELYIWNALNGELIQKLLLTNRKLTTYSDDTCSVAFDPDGKTILSATSLERDIKIWDIQSGKVISFRRIYQYISDFDLSSDGNHIASGTPLGHIRIDDLSSDTDFNNLTSNGVGAIRSIRYSPDGAALVFLHDEGYLESWDVTKYELIFSYMLGLGSGSALAFSPDSSLIAIGSTPNIIGFYLNPRILYISSLRFATSGVDKYLHLAFSPDGHYLAGTYASRLQIWGILR